MDPLADPAGLGRMLAEATSMLDRFQAMGPAAGDDAAEGVGEAANGLITAKAVAPGQLSELVLNPRVMRMDSQTLAEETLAAVNAALADLRARSPQPAGPADFGTLAEDLRAIQEDATRQMTSFADALVDAQARIAAQGGR
ncbi:YbaB/EbfC family nucleoid-associated protein [Longispora urticae]